MFSSLNLGLSEAQTPGLFNKLCLRNEGLCCLAVAKFSKILNALNSHRVNRKQGHRAACWKGTEGLRTGRTGRTRVEVAVETMPNHHGKNEKPNQACMREAGERGKKSHL